MTCTSNLPKLGRPVNWFCTGKDLMIVMWTTINGARVPIVVPRDFLTDVLSDPMMARVFDTPVPFGGDGDHAHISVPEDASFTNRMAAMHRLQS